MPQLGMPYANTFNAPTEGLFQQATKGGLFVRHFFLAAWSLVSLIKTRSG
jgi:hypothetical protein